MHNLCSNYKENGFVVIKKAVDSSYINEFIHIIKPVADKMKKLNISNSQRIGNLQSYPDIVPPNLIPSFYSHCKNLNIAISQIFDDEIIPKASMPRDPHITSILISPPDKCWSTGLHRDYRDFGYINNITSLNEWKSYAKDMKLFNQINIALHKDDCFWIVPGSYLRNDTILETILVYLRKVLDPRHKSNNIKSNKASKAIMTFYKQILSLAGGKIIKLGPGDAVIYRSNALHAGFYNPSEYRLTLHDAVYSLEWLKFALKYNRTNFKY